MYRNRWYLLLLASSMFVGSCQIAQTDYYSQLIVVCPKPIPDATGHVMIPLACQSALLQTLSFDQTFDQVSSDRKQEIVNTFFHLLYAPLRYPKNNQILQQGAHTIPLQYVCLLTPELDPEGCHRPELKGKNPNPNRALINYILNSLSTFSYEASSQGNPTNLIAQYQGLTPGEVKIYDKFWDAFSTNAWYIHIAILAHESKHAHDSWHIACGDQRGFECDSDFTGAYGLESVVLEMILHGIDEETPGSLTEDQMLELNQFMCNRLLHIKSSSSEFRIQVPNNSCAQLPLSFFSQAEDLVSVSPIPIPVPPVAPTSPIAIQSQALIGE